MMVDFSNSGYVGQRCDIMGEPMVNPVGHFARGATGRVCLVLVTEGREGDVLRTIDEVCEWAESVPNGYLDY